jgi:predicted DsbA family dithiol-disulfide isomerase
VNYDIDVKIVHYPLHPETPAAGMTLEKLFAGRGFDVAASQAHLRELAQAEGLPYGDRTMTYNSRLAQELQSWAATVNGVDELHNALCRAYFAEGLDISNRETLIDVVARVELPVDEARGVLESRSFKEEVDADWERSRQLGIDGVPTFVIAQRVLVGAHPYETLEELVVGAGASPKT